MAFKHSISFATDWGPLGCKLWLQQIQNHTWHHFQAFACCHLELLSCSILLWADAFLRQVVDLDLLVCTGFDLEHAVLFPWIVFHLKSVIWHRSATRFSDSQGGTVQGMSLRNVTWLGSNLALKEFKLHTVHANPLPPPPTHPPPQQQQPPPNSQTALAGGCRAYACASRAPNLPGQPQWSPGGLGTGPCSRQWCIDIPGNKSWTWISEEKQKCRYLLTKSKPLVFYRTRTGYGYPSKKS